MPTARFVPIRRTITASMAAALVLGVGLPAAANPTTATITLRSGLLERSAQATLTFPRAGSATTVKITPVDDGWAFLAMAVLLVVLLGAALLWAVARRRRDTPPDPDHAADGQFGTTTHPRNDGLVAANDVPSLNSAS